MPDNWVDWEEVAETSPYPEIKIVSYGKFYDLNTGYIIDPKHPKCYYCGRFVPIKWDTRWTGPCYNCYEDTTFL